MVAGDVRILNMLSSFGKMTLEHILEVSDVGIWEKVFQTKVTACAKAL